MNEPWELRESNALAPAVYRGMEGAPGHQAAALTVGDARGPYAEWSTGARDAYRNAGAHTLGGFDQMTALVGGVWDSMLGEGRRFWIVATSDSHVHYTEATRTGMDFWPGEFQKTYVHAQNTYADVLDGLRSGPGSSRWPAILFRSSMSLPTHRVRVPGSVRPCASRRTRP